MSQSHAFPPDAPAPLLDSVLSPDQAFLDALPIGIYVCDTEGLILRVNRKAAELWGRTPKLLDPADRFCGSYRVETLDGRFIPRDQTPMARAILFGESFEGFEAIVENPDGRRWVARVVVRPLLESGRMIGAVNCFRDVSSEHELHRTLERQRRTFDLAMVAAKMGTWRYTLADNICTYDENAQKLYGLTEARFLHDEAGVAARFHPDDMERMWASVAKALNPEGDGRYEVEYRVRQPDGEWRWLSAWGLVEFEGAGPERKPVAINGASRDLTHAKEAEELQKLLVNELNHRVKNSLATVQSIASQTLRRATDLQAARADLEGRIGSLARAHDLLTDRSWAGADFRDVVARALEPFAAAQLSVAGPQVELAPQHALALSMALHELATNAAKYGALSNAEGRVQLGWEVDRSVMRFSWVESGGPPVSPPARRGFGTRLLLDGMRHEFGSQTRLDYAPNGVRCEIQVQI